MTVTLRKPTSPEYKNFSREVKRRAKIRYENFTYGEEEVNGTAIVLLYCKRCSRQLCLASIQIMLTSLVQHDTLNLVTNSSYISVFIRTDMGLSGCIRVLRIHKGRVCPGTYVFPRIHTVLVSPDIYEFLQTVTGLSGRKRVSPKTCGFLRISMNLFGQVRVCPNVYEFVRKHTGFSGYIVCLKTFAQQQLSICRRVYATSLEKKRNTYHVYCSVLQLQKPDLPTIGCARIKTKC